MELNFVNFIKYFIFHPNSDFLSAKDQKIALVGSIALGVFTIGLVHVFSAIINRNYKPLPPDPGMRKLFQETTRPEQPTAESGATKTKTPLQDPAILGKVMSYLPLRDRGTSSMVSKEWKGDILQVSHNKIKVFFQTLPTLIAFLKELKNEAGALKYARSIGNLQQLHQAGPQIANSTSLQTHDSYLASLQESVSMQLKTLDLRELQELKRHSEGKTHSSSLIQIVDDALFHKELDVWANEDKPVENRAKARTKILSCYHNRHSPEGEILNLAELGLTSVPLSISKLTHLKELIFSNNYLTTLPEEIGNLINLRVMIINDNKLTTIPESIKNLTNLQNLWLNKNRITALPESMRELTNLELLDLSENQLKVFPQEILSLINLRYLSLFLNKLETVPEEISKLVHLEFLDLSQNELKVFPQEILSLTNLRDLSLGWNKLETVPEEISKLVHLEFLDLSGHSLRKCPKGIAKLTKLRRFVFMDKYFSEEQKKPLIAAFDDIIRL